MLHSIDYLLTPTNIVLNMALYGADVEIGIHTLLCLLRTTQPVSSHELATYQGLSPTHVAKVLGRLQQAGVVASSPGKTGGYLLARSAAEISLTDVVDAIEGPKPLFACRDIRFRCELLAGDIPEWATCSMCAVNSAMKRAESAMRDVLAKTTLRQLGEEFVRKAPPEFLQRASGWFVEHREQRVSSGRPSEP